MKSHHDDTLKGIKDKVNSLRKDASAINLNCQLEENMDQGISMAFHEPSIPETVNQQVDIEAIAGPSSHHIPAEVDKKVIMIPLQI